MTFGAPQWFWGLLALPVLLLVFVRSERRGAQRLRDFVSPRLLPQLADRVDHFRRRLKLVLQLAGLGLAIIALAQPRWGYNFAEAKRKGIDLLLAVDTSRSMLSNDVQPNRLERVKLATQDLINQLEGDRVGLIAFAGRAFVQAPLTIDYGAAVEAIRDLDTKTIPEGGTNISEAITLADKTYGKSASGNRALVIFTDGEELSGDALKTAKVAAEAGARIFTVGVGTQQGSLIPIAADQGNAFVKDAKGQVVKSRLDEKRLREIAEATGGFYLHLENSPSTMRQLVTDGMGKMKAGDIDVRLSRRAIERFEWPLGAGLAALAFSLLIGDRKRARAVTGKKPSQSPKKRMMAAAAFSLLSVHNSFGSAPGLDAYRGGQFEEAYQQFQGTLKDHPETGAADKLQFDTGTAAYKLKDYGKALEAFSQALLSSDKGLQEKSHYNLGNTLYQRGDKQPGDDKKLTDWNNALQHYEQAMKLEPQNKEAKENYDYVKRKMEEVKNKPKPSPSPSPGENEGQGENGTPSPTPGDSPGKKLTGDLKGSSGDQQAKPQSPQEEAAEVEAETEGQMSERQAEALLQSMKDEEARVQLDERKARRHVYNDW